MLEPLLNTSAQLPPAVHRLGTYFGFGTILSTAFIHMMLPAVEKLSSDCLSDAWNSYTAWGYMFVVVAILLMQVSRA
jgi:zinc transporter 1/2/3